MFLWDGYLNRDTNIFHCVENSSLELQKVNSGAVFASRAGMGMLIDFNSSPHVFGPISTTKFKKFNYAYGWNEVLGLARPSAGVQ